MSTLALESLAWVMLLVDRSASMETIQEPTLRGLQAFIRGHRNQLNTRLSVVQFGTGKSVQLEMTTLFDTEMPRASQSRALERLDYRPRGDTPLLAAVLAAIGRMEKFVRCQDRALLVIQTDGLENASPKHITLAAVRQRIADKRQLGNWTFAYLGTDLDDWHVPPTGQDMGIGPFHTLSWSPTPRGVTAAFKTTSEAVTRWRTAPSLGGPERFYPLQLPPPSDQWP
jgi:hypothetical protein